MIVVHHLDNSRSQRVLWLLEELGLPYEIGSINVTRRPGWRSRTETDPLARQVAGDEEGGRVVASLVPL